MWPFRPKRERIIPPVDLNKPVTNPALRDAIEELARRDDEQTRMRVGAELNRANFLVAMLDDEMVATPTEIPGQITIQKDSLLKILGCENESGEATLPLFTDWDEIRAWTKEPVSTLVMPSASAWSFVLSNSYEGAVVNPAGRALPLSRYMVQLAAQELEELKKG